MELLLDIVIIILIAIMIAYSVALNGRLKAFRNIQNEMASLIAGLDKVILQAQNSVDSLKKTANVEEQKLKDLIAKSRMLADELEIITDSGSNLADRIERGLVPRPEIIEDDGEIEAKEDIEEDSEMLKALKNTR